MTDVFEIVSRYYPKVRVPAKTRFLVETTTHASAGPGRHPLRVVCLGRNQIRRKRRHKWLKLHRTHVHRA